MARRSTFRAIAIYSIACLPAALLFGDVATKNLRERRQPVNPVEVLPKEVFNSAIAAVELTGDDLVTFLKREPIATGGRAPSVSARDFRKRNVAIPTSDRRPTIAVVSCGCLKCAPFVHELADFGKKHGPRVQVVAFVATESHYIWGHHASTFSLHPDIRLVHDHEGRYLRLMRPQGDRPTELPFVWACDGDGTIRYAGQPRDRADWVGPVETGLGLPKTAFPRILP
jgi:hypothetical protein